MTAPTYPRWQFTRKGRSKFWRVAREISDHFLAEYNIQTQDGDLWFGKDDEYWERRAEAGFSYYCHAYFPWDPAIMFISPNATMRLMPEWFEEVK